MFVIITKLASALAKINISFYSYMYKRDTYYAYINNSISTKVHLKKLSFIYYDLRNKT